MQYIIKYGKRGSALPFLFFVQTYDWDFTGRGLDTSTWQPAFIWPATLLKLRETRHTEQTSLDETLMRIFNRLEQIIKPQIINSATGSDNRVYLEADVRDIALVFECNFTRTFLNDGKNAAAAPQNNSYITFYNLRKRREI